MFELCTAGNEQLADVVDVMRCSEKNLPVSAIRGKTKKGVKLDKGVRFILDHAGNPDIAAASAMAEKQSISEDSQSEKPSKAKYSENTSWHKLIKEL